MLVMISGRQTGKTTRLLKWLEDAPEGEHRVLVSMSSERAMRLLDQSRREGRPLESWQFVGIDEVRPGGWPMVLRGRGGRIVLGIDDFDAIIRSLIGYEVGTLTMTGEHTDKNEKV